MKVARQREALSNSPPGGLETEREGNFVIRLHRLPLLASISCSWLLMLGVAAAAPADFRVTIRTGSGDLRLVNTSANTLNLAAYSITFPTAQLRGDEWLPIAGRLDASGDGSLDSNNDWLVLEPQPIPALTNSLSEGEFLGDGGFLQTGEDIFFGAVWNPSTANNVNFEIVEVVGGNATASFLDITYLPPGDFNEDGLVDAADYTVWRDNLGQTGIGLQADSDGNGIVDAADYDAWKLSFGTTSFVVSAPGAAGLATALVVPEPSSLASIVAAAVLLLRFARWSR